MDYKVSDRRSVEADRFICKTFQIVNLREKTKTIFLCWKDFTNYFIGVKKRISKHLLDNMVPNNRYSCSDYMVLFFWIYVGKKIDNMLKQRRAFGPIGLFAKPFPNREFKRETKNIFLCWKPFTNYFIG